MVMNVSGAYSYSSPYTKLEETPVSDVTKLVANMITDITRAPSSIFLTQPSILPPFNHRVNPAVTIMSVATINANGPVILSTSFFSGLSQGREPPEDANAETGNSEINIYNAFLITFSIN
jgi:hypothetical protein